MSDQQPDKLYASPLDKHSDFAFDEAVARVFPDMIRRSVPGYTTIVPMLGVIAEQYAQDDTYCYDLGCSLGASTLAMRHGLKSKQCQLIGVDNSPSMIERCKHYVELDNETTPVQLVCDDIQNITFAPCSLVTLNFTLQFLPLADRLPLLSKIQSALVPGGALVLSEKIRFADEHEQRAQQELHWMFKKANGYSDLEISQKRSAIERVLLPETLAEHQDRLSKAGFTRSFVWYQCFNFCSLIAFK